MDDRLGSIERQVDELSRALADVQERLGRMERQAATALLAARPAAMPGAATPGAAVATAREDGEVATVLALTGRTCLVLGGAYLLRALTDTGVVQRPVGTLVGVAYAMAWLLVANWQGLSGGPLVPAFYGAASALIAFPLLWEATVSFHLLNATGAALAMSGITGVALAIAWRLRLQSLAWITTCAGLLAAPLFMLALGPAVPLGFYLTFLGIVTLWMGYSLDWIWLRWPVAIVVDLTVAVMAGSVTGAWHRQGASAVMLLQLTLFGGYLASVASRTIWRSRDVIPFEVVQMIALLVVGFGGAAYVMVATGSGAGVLGVVSLVFGLVSYRVAFAFVDWQRGHWKNFLFYTSLGLVFVLAGTTLTTDARAQAIIWAALAVACAALAYRYHAAALCSHTAAYLVAAALVSGLLSFVSDAFLGSADREWTGVSWQALSVLVAAAACCALPVPFAGERFHSYARLPKLVVAVILLLGVGATAIAVAVPVLSASPGVGADPAVVAGLRTLVLAAAALLLAWLGGAGLFEEGKWLTYVVLVIGGFKLLVSDFLTGRPSTLFVSLALYGAALIVAPRWARRGQVRRAVESEAPVHT